MRAPTDPLRSNSATPAAPEEAMQALGARMAQGDGLGA